MSEIDRQTKYRAGLKAKGMTSCKITVPIDRADDLKAYASRLRNGDVPLKHKKSKEEEALTYTLRGLSMDMKRAVRLFMKEDIEHKLDKLVEKAVKDAESSWQWDKYLGSIEEQRQSKLSDKDISRIRNCLHPDRQPDDKQDKFSKALASFNKSI